MKWVKFKHEFDQDQPLYKFLKEDGIKELILDLDAPENSGGQKIIYKAGKPNGVIDKSFRIYDLPKEKFEEVYLKDHATYKDKIVFHRWPYDVDLRSDRKKSSDNSMNALENPHVAFAGGWIEFWDREVRHGNVDHALYFKVPDIGKHAIAYILQTVAHVDWNFYINIASPPTSTDPPPPTSGKPPY